MKILILENDGELDPLYPFAEYVDQLKQDGHQLKFIYNAYSSGDQIIAQINWPDALVFTTTFVYIHPIYELATAIAKYRKEPLEMRIMADDIDDAIKWMVDKYASYPVYDGPDSRGPQYEYTWYLDQDKAEQFGYMFKHIDIQRLSFDRKPEITPIRTLFGLASAWQLKIDADKDFLASRRLDNPQALTGRMIRIRPGILASAPGKEWSKLKPGTIVPELSMLGASDRVQGKQHDRGAWVMGLTEPVKILNDDPGSGRKFDEFEYVIETVDDLAHEIMKMCNRTATKDYLFIQGALKNTEMSAHWKATEILDAFEMPRRQNRQVMEKRIQEMENKFPEFKEVA
jgi:hypothetical protein